MGNKFSEYISSKTLKRISQQSWYRHGIYRDNVLMSSVIAKGLTIQQFRKEGMDRTFDYLKIDEGAHITDEDFFGLKKLMQKKLAKWSKYLPWYLKAYEADNQRLLVLSREIKKQTNNDLTNKEIWSLFNRFCSVTVNLSHWLWSMEFLNPAIDEFSRKLIKKYQPEWPEASINEFITEISYFNRKLAWQAEQAEVIKVKKDNYSQIRKLHKKYAWLPLNTWDGRPFTLAQYQQRIKKMLRSKNTLEKNVRSNQLKAKKASTKIRQIKDRQLRQFLYLLQALIRLKTYRIDVYSQSWYIIWSLVELLQRRLNISYRQLLLLAPEDIKQMLLSDQKIKLSELNKRHNYIIGMLNNELCNFYGAAYKKISASVDHKSYNQIKVLKGVVGYRGKVRGRAKVLLTDRQLDKIKKGDILVANLTNPNYNAAFSKIKAVVTDEGGILCHSAIMAREFSIPCVVGTKIATKVFKDGDLVEVDADKGVIRKI